MAWSVRILVAHPCSSVRRRWMKVIAPLCSAIDEARDGWELLWMFAEHGAYRLVVAGDLAGISGLEALSMTRAAGMTTPFIFPFRDPLERASVRRALKPEG